MWFACTFSYYMLNFYMKYMPGNIYNNNYALSTGEIVACLTCGLVYSFLRAKKAFALGFVIALVGGILIILLGTKMEPFMPVFIIIARFGISISFSTVYIA